MYSYWNWLLFWEETHFQLVSKFPTNFFTNSSTKIIDVSSIATGDFKVTVYEESLTRQNHSNVRTVLKDLISFLIICHFLLYIWNRLLILDLTSVGVQEVAVRILIMKWFLLVLFFNWYCFISAFVPWGDAESARYYKSSGSAVS